MTASKKSFKSRGRSDVDRTFTNELSDAQAERLAILLEELGEAQQVIGKILRHGYESFDPTGKVSGDNRFLLTKELGDVRYAVMLMAEAGDISESAIHSRINDKAERIKPYLHHQAR